LTGFTPGAKKDMAQGSVSRGHYSNQFECNDPRLLALALYIFQLTGIKESLHGILEYLSDQINLLKINEISVKSALVFGLRCVFL
jgi:hypothetical protein